MKTRKIIFTVGVVAVILVIIAAAAIILWPKKKLSAELNVYNWTEYLSPEVILGFEKEYGVKINMHYYDDEFIMLHELENNPNTDKYDLIVAGNSIMGRLIESDLLAPIDDKNIPNLKNIGSEFKDTVFNAKNIYGVPYSWGTTGMLVNKKFIPNADSWDVLWNKKYTGKICMLSDPAEVIGAAAKYLGLPLVPQSVEQMNQVRDALLAQKSITQGYCDYTTASDGAVSGEFWAVEEWSGTAATAIMENSDLSYVIPKEGGASWFDMFAVPKNAKNKYTAEAFLNYLNRPEVNAKNVEYVLYASCNEGAKEFISKDILDNQIIYPSKAVMNRLDSYTDFIVDDEVYKMRNELWDELNK